MGLPPEERAAGRRGRTRGGRPHTRSGRAYASSGRAYARSGARSPAPVARRRRPVVRQWRSGGAGQPVAVAYRAYAYRPGAVPAWACGRVGLGAWPRHAVASWAPPGTTQSRRERHPVQTREPSRGLGRRTPGQLGPPWLGRAIPAGQAGSDVDACTGRRSGAPGGAGVETSSAGRAPDPWARYPTGRCGGTGPPQGPVPPPGRSAAAATALLPRRTEVIRTAGGHGGFPRC